MNPGLTLLSVLLSSLVLQANAQNESGRSVVLKMAEAHGGYDVWKKAKAISYDNIFFNPGTPPGENPWWFSHEVFDQKTRNTYHDWTLDGAALASDGKQVWTVDWKQSNHPAFMAYFFYYFVNLPWLALENNVKLTDMGRRALPGQSTQYLTVKMEFVKDPPIGRTLKDFFILYIHPQTYHLSGYQYNVSYGGMLDLMELPKEVDYMGPVLRIIDQLKESDGLLYPARFHTMDLEGTQTFGYHIITNFSTREKFDNSRLSRTSNSVVDVSSAQRK
jgi:hypothetical protein